MSNRNDRIKAILRDLDLPIGSEKQNEDQLIKFMREHGYRGIKNINIMKSWYEEFKTNYKKELLSHFNIVLTDNDDVDSKLNELLRDHQLEVQNPTFGWLMNWFERTKAERLLEDEWRSYMDIQTPDVPLQRSHDERLSNYEFLQDLMNIQTPDVPLQRSHDERLLDYEWRSYMDMTTPNYRFQVPHEERHKRYVERVTRNLLHGDINPEVSEEGIKFIQRHKPRDLYKDEECILLFEPADENGFRECLHEASYKTNQVVFKDHDLYRNYYLNRLTNINKVLELLDRIVQECTPPFKIMCDCGFIVEDATDSTYKSMPPKEDEVERSVPFTITKNIDMETYKHYIYSFISEKMERIHISSSHRYVAIYGFLFKVVKLNKAGAKFKTDGYEFLNKSCFHKCLRIVYGKSNTCIFNSYFHQKSRGRFVRTCPRN